MQYISLNNNSLTYFTAKGQLSELSGSSKYKVFDNELVIKENIKKPKIENTTWVKDYVQNALNDNLTDNLLFRLCCNYSLVLASCKRCKWTSEIMNNRLEQLEQMIVRYKNLGYDGLLLKSKISEDIRESNSMYYKNAPYRSKLRKLNKSKVRAKIYALFNTRKSRKFVAFYSVSFPFGNNDDMIFECWNYWLTYLRKNFGLSNYVWVSERQMNGTLHYHMFTNQFIPISQSNRAMAVIINNQVNQGLMSWGSSSLSRYNGVDVDSIFNSKRHKKTGKFVTASEVREWLQKYVTKYVSKNNETFTHLAWHCSRSVSQLFTSTIYEQSEQRTVTDNLPLGYLLSEFKPEFLADKYILYESEYCNTWIFKFIANQIIYDKIRCYNEEIFSKHVIKHKINYNQITFLTDTI